MMITGVVVVVDVVIDALEVTSTILGTITSEDVVVRTDFVVMGII